MSQDIKNQPILLVDAEIAFGIQFALFKAGLAKVKGDHWLNRERIHRAKKRNQQALEFLLLYDRVLIPERIIDVKLTPDARKYIEVIPDDTNYWQDSAWIQWLMEYFKQITKDPTTDTYNKHYQENPLDISVDQQQPYLFSWDKD